jgi:cardiolipin synthase
MPTALTFVPLWHRADEWAHRLRHIREARQFLYLSAFYLEYDRYGQEMLDALLAAQRRGVAVQLILDSFGQTLGGVLMTAAQRRALAEHCDHLTRAGANITHYRPTLVAQRLAGGGQHVKIQVSDTGEVLFGSSNITASSYEGWHEYSVAMTGPVTRTLLESLKHIGGTVDPAHLDALPVHDDRATLAFDYWFCNPNLTQSWQGPFGWRGHNEVTQQIIGMVESARQTLRLTSFYFKPTPPLLQAVLAAARRGVRVEVYHSHRDALPTTDLAWIAAASTYAELLDVGVRIYEHRTGEHSKIILVDDAWVSFGSYNCEDAAHDRLAEAMLASRDPRVISPAQEIFRRLSHDPANVHVTAEHYRQWPRRLQTRVRALGRFKWWM